MAEIFRKENTKAYLAVLAAYVLAVALEWTFAPGLFAGAPPEDRRGGVLLLFAGASTLAGMAILFVASLLNLRKMKTGFRQIAEGNPSPVIPPVWCLVLTEARRSALQLAARLNPPAAAEGKP